METKEVKRLYVNEMWTLRRVAKHFGTNHHRVKRMLVALGVEITNEHRFREPMPVGRRAEIGRRSMGHKAWNKGIAANEGQIRRMMKARMRTSIDLDAYPDLNRLQLLVRLTSKHFKHFGMDADRKAFLDRFYFDAQFNRIYDKWEESGKNKWLIPSLDHKVSKCNGGSWELDNLQFLTWFENRAKAEMNQDEWESFKQSTQTKSDLFV